MLALRRSTIARMGKVSALPHPAIFPSAVVHCCTLAHPHSASAKRSQRSGRPTVICMLTIHLCTLEALGSATMALHSANARHKLGNH